VETASLDNGFQAIFGMHDMAWLGEHRMFGVEEFIRNGDLPMKTQRTFCIRFELGGRDLVLDKNVA